MVVGTRVRVTRGGHRGKKATIVECPDIQFSLSVGGQSCGSQSLRSMDQSSHLVWIKFDDDTITGGYWGSGVFEYARHKLEDFTVLDELARI
jgi:hypothetical protein